MNTDDVKYWEHDNTFHSAITLEDIYYGYVGFIYCGFNRSLSDNTIDLIGLNKISSIYVFVADSPIKLVPLHIDRVITFVNLSVLIPCKPTSPELEAEVTIITEKKVMSFFL